jgi:hypothetical protein
MAHRKMVILRGNSAPAGSYPDEQGNMISWPIGALHVDAAVEFARRMGFEGVVLPVAGQPQSQTSPQARAALKAFHEDEAVRAFYGFSGGGYNMRHILQYMAENEPYSLQRIDLVVILGSPLQPRANYLPVNYNLTARRKVHPKPWTDASWELIYKTNPPRSAMPDGLPKGLDTHMFGPDVLLRETPAGRYRDWQFDDC